MTKARIREIRAFLQGPDYDVAGPGEIIAECISEIDRLQAMTRRGIGPDAEPIPPAEKTKAKADPRIEEFKLAWVDYFEQFHKEKYAYKGAQDTQAIKRLLLIADTDTLLDRAWDAWHHPHRWDCLQATTIAGFASQYNKITAALKLLKNGNRPVRTQPAGCTL